jgi:hypothetical protein
MDFRKFEVEIRKTGFDLEHQVATALRAAGWTVISNRYYVDDQEDAVREMDLVAYRVKNVADFEVFTTLIISCKKSEKNVWALLARTRDRNDPNADWWPAHVWSNDQVSSFMANQPGWREEYHLRAGRLGVQRALAEPEVDIFAYQEMNRESGAPQNDKPIFASVTSLMKAQSYELDALPQRKKTRAVYQFNLLAVVDADLLRLYFDGPRVVASAVSDEQYVARYIIKRKDTVARIHFVNIQALPTVLDDYARLHVANATIFGEDKEAFYRGAVSDPVRVALFAAEFNKAVDWTLNWRIRRHSPGHAELEPVFVSWSEENQRVEISIGASDDAVRFLAGDREAREVVSDALKDLYRYEGPFEFVEDGIPF